MNNSTIKIPNRVYERSSSTSRSPAPTLVAPPTPRSPHSSSIPFHPRSTFITAGAGKEGKMAPTATPTSAAGNGNGNGATPVTGRPNRFVAILKHFIGHRTVPPAVPPFLSFLPLTYESYLLSYIGSLVSVLLVISLSYALSLDFRSLPLAVASMGATAVLLYALPEAPLSQPRSAIGGHLVSATTGMVFRTLFGLDKRFGSEAIANRDTWELLTPVAGCLAVSLATVLMTATKTTHPPAGATALIAIFQPTDSWSFLLLVLLSTVVMTLWACIINNFGTKRRYPIYFWSPIKPPPVVKEEPQGIPEIGSKGGEKLEVKDETLNVTSRRELDEEETVRGRSGEIVR